MNNFSHSPYSSPLGSPGGEAGSIAIMEKRLKTGANWFFFIAVFSLINSLLILQGGSYHSAFGLGTTQIISSAASHPAPGQTPFAASQGMVLTFDFLASGFYVLYGFFGRRGQIWAFLTGMGFYALDLLLLLLADFLLHGGLQTASWLAVAFHGYALFRIFQGYEAARRLPDLRAQQALGSQNPPPSSAPGIWPPPPSTLT